jgi:hypothetical protein
MNRVTAAAVATLLLTAAADAGAQTAYVGASLFGDIVRLSGTRTVRTGDVSPGGEALGFTVRVGTPLGARWGVEAEFARPAEFEDERTNDILPLAEIAQSLPPGVTLPTVLFPSFAFRTTYRNTTMSTAAWARQELSARASLVYLAGLGFYRSEREVALSFDPRALIAPLPPILPYETETILYGVTPFAGIEARIGMGGRAQLVPGLRLHGIEGGWLVRPGIGVNWMF